MQKSHSETEYCKSINIHAMLFGKYPYIKGQDNLTVQYITVQFHKVNFV